MRWKTKSRIQNAISALPKSLSYPTYYWIQRHFGALRKINPTSRIDAAVDTCKLLEGRGADTRDKVFLEIGTGRMPITPLAYWLVGARRVITVDLNCYVKAELIQDALAYLLRHDDEIRKRIGAMLVTERMEKLAHFARLPSFTLKSFFEEFSITYLAPSDAADLSLADDSIDFHTSFNVFEHIPYQVLKRILREGNRVIRDGGLFVHRIDYSDHFSHTDSSISGINFLQYADRDWEEFAGNRYMYMNRLRHDDILSLFEDAGHRVLDSHTHLDERCQELLRAGRLRLDEKFESKTNEVLSIASSWIISEQLERDPRPT